MSVLQRAYSAVLNYSDFSAYLELMGDELLNGMYEIKDTSRGLLLWRKRGSTLDFIFYENGLKSRAPGHEQIREGESLDAAVNRLAKSFLF